MPYNPADLHKNSRAALDSKFKAVSQIIDERIRGGYDGKSPARVIINADAEWVGTLLFEIIKSNYTAYGWNVEKQTEVGDMRDCYTSYSLIFTEVPKNDYNSREHGVCGGMGYGGNDR
jgi:hypothetical protein